MAEYGDGIDWSALASGPAPPPPPPLDVDAASAPGPAAPPAPPFAPMVGGAGPGPASAALAAPVAPPSFLSPAASEALVATMTRPEDVQQYRAEAERAAAQVKEGSGQVQVAIAPHLRRYDELAARHAREVGDYQAALREPRPIPPETKPLPPAPDVTPKPWLTSDGKNALLTIAQTISALAVGINGIKTKTPQTTLRLFREATELWRQGELDKANGAWREFQANVEKIRDENTQALSAFDRADRAHGQNVAAKQAATAATLAEMGLEEHAIAVARLPYEEARKATEQALGLTKGALDASLAYDELMGKQRLAEETKKATQAYRDVQIELQRQQMRETHEDRQERMQDAREERRARREERRAAPAAGFWIDKEKGEAVSPTVGELADHPGRFTKTDVGDLQTFKLLKNAIPMVERLRELTPKILAKYPVENLMQALRLRFEGVIASNPDLREYTNLAEEAAVEMTRALGAGGQLRVTLLQILRENISVKTSDTIQTADRSLQTVRRSLENRRASIAGQDLKPFGMVWGPGTWLAVSSDGRRAKVFVPAGKSLGGEDGWTVEDMISLP